MMRASGSLTQQAAGEFEARDVGQVDIDHRDVRLIERIDLLRRGRIARLEHGHVRGLGEQCPATRQDDGMVVDDKDFQRHRFGLSHN